MKFLKRTVMTFIALLVILAATTQWLAWKVEARFPALGAFAEIGGVRLHYIDMPAGAGSDLAPMVFLHGASGNARDLHGAFSRKLEGRARMIFLDRPGAGYSSRGGAEMAAPDAQARLVAGLMEHLGIERAVVIGHSLGAAVAAAFGVNHPDKTAGLVFIAPATHPWPGGGVSWYYDVANIPVLGRLFTETVAVPFGNLMYGGAIRSVFAPDKVASSYSDLSGTQLVLRPANFRFNAQDVGGLFSHVSRIAPQYGDIDAPSVIITGDSDDIVRADIHSEGLARDIAEAKLVRLPLTGHTPTWSATDAVINEIELLNTRIAR